MVVKVLRHLARIAVLSAAMVTVVADLLAVYLHTEPFASSGGSAPLAKPSVDLNLGLGRGLINAQPEPYGCQLDECAIGGAELVIAGLPHADRA